MTVKTDKNVVKEFIDGFISYTKNDQLERAKETKGMLEKLNTPTLSWLIKTSQEIISEREKEQK